MNERTTCRCGKPPNECRNPQCDNPEPIAEAQPDRFEPTEESRALLKQWPDVGQDLQDKFFALVETEKGDYRKAGSIIVAVYGSNLARIAAFGALSSGNRPSEALWLERAREDFRRAVAAVEQAFNQVEAIERTTD